MRSTRRPQGSSSTRVRSPGMPAISPFLLTHAQSNQGLEALNGPALAFPGPGFLLASRTDIPTGTDRYPCRATA
jgi:hypothetical protein